MFSFVDAAFLLLGFVPALDSGLSGVEMALNHSAACTLAKVSLPPSFAA
jgi:hypothetical protein